MAALLVKHHALPFPDAYRTLRGGGYGHNEVMRLIQAARASAAKLAKGTP